MADVFELDQQCSAGNQDACQQLVTIARDPNVDPLDRLHALYALRDQSALADIAKNDQEPPIRWTAMQIMRDEALLISVALSARSREDRDAANAALTKLRASKAAGSH
jgi:hypothetical protein